MCLPVRGYCTHSFTFLSHHLFSHNTGKIRSKLHFFRRQKYAPNAIQFSTLSLFFLFSHKRSFHTFSVEISVSRRKERETLFSFYVHDLFYCNTLHEKSSRSVQKTWKWKYYYKRKRVTRTKEIRGCDHQDMISLPIHVLITPFFRVSILFPLSSFLLSTQKSTSIAPILKQYQSLSPSRSLHPSCLPFPNHTVISVLLPIFLSAK